MKFFIHIGGRDVGDMIRRCLTYKGRKEDGRIGSLLFYETEVLTFFLIFIFLVGKILL